MGAIWNDIGYAWRRLRRSPGFAVAAVVTLTLGIGASTAIFSLFQQVFLRVLPVDKPGELVQLRYTGLFKGHSHSFGGDEHQYFSYPMYRDLRERGTEFAGVIGDDMAGVGAMWHGQSQLERTELVTGNYFSVLGVKPALGRVLLPEDEGQPGANPVVVLGYDEWQHSFGGARDVVGQKLLVNGQPFEIVGVAERGFGSVISDFRPGLYVPITMRSLLKAEAPDENVFENRKFKWMPVYARLAPGLRRERAQAASQPLWHNLRAYELSLRGHSSQQFVDGFLTHSTLQLDPAATGFSPLRDELRTPLVVLLGMVLLLAAMAAANVAGLLLVRGAARERELAVRFALGATRARIVRQLMLEGLLLGVAGAVLGAAAAPPLAALLARRLLGSGTVGVFSFAPNPAVLGFTLLLSLVVSVSFSVVPSFSAASRRQASADALRQGHGGGGARAAWLRRGAVLLQVCLSVMLLSGAGLFVRTLHNLKTQDVGLSSDHVVVFGMDPGLAGYTGEATAAVHRRVAERLAALPGVQAVGGTTDADLVDDDDTGNLTVEGHPSTPEHEIEAEQPAVLPGYFAALRIPLLAGRGLTAADATAPDKVAIVNELFAKTFFGSAQGALGHRFAHGAGNAVVPDTRIVGVVANAKHKLRDRVKLTEYEPFRGTGSLTYYVRTAQSPAAAEASVRAAVHEVDPRIVLGNIGSMDEQIDGNLGAERALALLAASFSAVALLTAGVGLYGVLAFATAQRTREIGIRMALGAVRGAVVRLVVGDMVAWCAGAVVLALAAAAGLARMLASQLYAVRRWIPWCWLDVCC